MSSEEWKGGRPEGPLVSIITPMYNGAAFVGETIESVLTQSFKQWEHLIVDDGSRDNGALIVAGYAERDSRIRLIQQANGGAASARNRALQEAQGRYIVFLDSDDLWDADFLDRQIAFLKQSGTPIVYGSYRRVNERGEEIMKPFIAPARATYDSILLSNPISCLTSIVDRAAVGEVHFDESWGSMRDDLVMWLDLLNRTQYAAGNEDILASYRIHSDQVTGNKFRVLKPQYRVYRRVAKFSAVKSLVWLIRWGMRSLRKYGA